ncbi:hypothetical protein CMI37_02070 [Candidatus Pacearchaeota archaeon]|nr:hypothetical protein [Candidatus Pacearchaeota archaeon]|tara:strand:+ start:1106 stop:1378 length:273 start_codon:yes stop_codon:yes gene_type:complete
MKQAKKRKVGSGRKKGSVSFSQVTLEQLNDMLGPKATVLISRKWAETVGIAGEMVTATPQTIKTAAGVEPTRKKKEPKEEVAVEVQLTEW